MAGAEPPIVSNSFTATKVRKDLYALVDCATNKLCAINNKPAIFEFKGDYNTGTHPEQLLGKVLAYVVDSGMQKHEGCFKFIDYTKDCDELYFDYQYFFGQAVICDSCADCNKNVVAPVERELIYAKYTPPVLDSDKITQDMCTFVQVVNQEMNEKKLGVKFICENDFMDGFIDHFSTVMDLKSCIEYKPEISPANGQLENKVCVFTLNEDFAKGFIEMYITIEKNEFPIVKSGAVTGESVYQHLVSELNSLGKGVWTYNFTEKTLSVTGGFEYANLIFTIGNTQTTYYESGLSFIFQPICTLV